MESWSLGSGAGALHAGQAPFRQFPRFVVALTEDGMDVQELIDDYLQDCILHPCDRSCWALPGKTLRSSVWLRRSLQGWMSQRSRRVKGKQTRRQASMSNTQTLQHVNVSEHRGPGTAEVEEFGPSA